MKKIVAICVFISILFGFSSKAKGQPPIYKISGNGLAKPSYIFGSLHVIEKKDFVLPKNIKPILKSCELLTMELQMDDLKEEAKKMASSMLLENGQTYEQLMNEEQYAWFTSYLSDTIKLGSLKTMIYTKFKPIFLSSAIMNEALKKPQSYEENILKLSKKYKLQHLGLETFEQQMSFLNAMPIELQLSSFKPGFMSEFFIMKDLYLKGDLDALHTWAKESMEGDEYKQMEQSLVTDRNNVWIPKMEEMMVNKPTFFAVGALHLPGENGVLQLLREAGYTVEVAE